MRLPVALRRPLYRLAYNVLVVYWFLARPSMTGVKCVLADADRILLVRHTYGPPLWELPGGGIKRGESPADAARREMREELGVQAEHWLELPVVRGRVNGRRDTLHCFRAELPNPQLTLDRGEIAEAGWFELHALPDRMGIYTERILAPLTSKG